jgi:hypothetical protein
METSEKLPILNLLRLHCFFVEEMGYDDVFLKYEGNKIWPTEDKQQPIMMDTITELDVEIKDITKNKEISIELWDWDLLSPNDKLGTFTLIVDEDMGTFSSVLLHK